MLQTFSFFSAKSFLTLYFWRAEFNILFNLNFTQFAFSVSIDGIASKTLFICGARMSQANDDPDFDLAEGSHQVAILCALARMIARIINTMHDLYKVFYRILKNK